MKSKTLIFLMTTSLAFVVIEAVNREIANSRGTQEASELLKSSDLNTQQDREYVESNEGRSDVDGTIFMPNKKYFDILPNDLYSDEDAGDVSLKTSKEEIENLPHSYEADDPLESAGRRVNSRRFRRDSTNSAGRQKRQNYFVNPYPLTHVPSSYPRYTVDFYFPNEPSYNHQPYQNIFRRDHYSQPQYFAPPPPRQFIPNYPTNYDAPSPSRNPFHPTNTNRLHRPGNLYLPPPPMTRPPPCGSANIPCPPDNNPNKDVVDNRLFGFEEPENKPIWHSQLVPNRNQQHHQGGGSGNLRPVENNKIDGMNRNPFGETSSEEEFEVEAPLSVFEDLNVELTTRAPLTTRKPDPNIEGLDKNPNRNANKKPNHRLSG